MPSEQDSNLENLILQPRSEPLKCLVRETEEATHEQFSKFELPDHEDRKKAETYEAQATCAADPEHTVHQPSLNSRMRRDRQQHVRKERDPEAHL